MPSMQRRGRRRSSAGSSEGPRGGCDLRVLKTESWRTRLDEADGKNSLLQKISKYWVVMKAKLGAAVFLNVKKVCFFLSAYVYVLGPEGMDVNASNLNVNLKPVA